jgi:hypothetical protein
MGAAGWSSSGPWGLTTTATTMPGPITRGGAVFRMPELIVCCQGLVCEVCVIACR